MGPSTKYILHLVIIVKVHNYLTIILLLDGVVNKRIFTTIMYTFFLDEPYIVVYTVIVVYNDCVAECTGLFALIL